MIVLRLLGILGATSITRAFGGVQKPFADGLFTKSFGQHGNGPHIPVVPDLSFNGLSYNDRLFTPVVESLSALGTDKFMKLEHPVFPNYSVRIKKSEFCDEKANAYTGYIDVEARHFFFYFVRRPRNQCTSFLIVANFGATSSKVETILPKTMSSSGQTEARGARVLLASSWS
jgi:hypothetical protein